MKIRHLILFAKIGLGERTNNKIKIDFAVEP